MEIYLKNNLGPKALKSFSAKRSGSSHQTKYVLPSDYKSGTEKKNGRITNRVIELQERGFDLDFQLLGGKEVLCIQNNIVFKIDNLEILVLEQAYDQFSHSQMFIHSVETFEGLRGILLSEKRYDIGLHLS